MRIDETRQQGGIAQVDHPRARGRRHIRAHRLNLLADHEHHAVLDHFSGHGIEHAVRLQEDAGGRRSIRGGGVRQSELPAGRQGQSA